MKLREKSYILLPLGILNLGLALYAAMMAGAYWLGAHF